MVNYNLTNVTDANSLYGITLAVNDVVGGLFANLVLLFLFIIILISFKDRYDFKVILLADSFIILILSGLLLAAGFINIEVLYVIIALMVASIFIYLLS